MYSVKTNTPFDFSTALDLLKSGKKLARREWVNTAGLTDDYLLFPESPKGRIKMLFRVTTEHHIQKTYTITNDDLFSPWFEVVA